MENPVALRSAQAHTPAEIAAALHYLPLQIYEYVLNHFEYEPYNGLLKGTQAVLETKAGNDWDLARFLSECHALAGQVAG